MKQQQIHLKLTNVAEHDQCIVCHLSMCHLKQVQEQFGWHQMRD